MSHQGQQKCWRHWSSNPVPHPSRPVSSVAPGGERRCLLPPYSFCGPVQAPKPDILPTSHTSLGWVSIHACTTSCSQGYTGPDSITSDGSFSPHPPRTRLIDSRCFKLEPEANIGSTSETSDPPGHLWGSARPHLHLHPYLPSPENVPSFLPTSPPAGSSLGGSQVLPLIPLPNPAHSTAPPPPPLLQPLPSLPTPCAVLPLHRGPTF